MFKWYYQSTEMRHWIIAFIAAAAFLMAFAYELSFIIGAREWL